jgi:hypothetical protein
LRDVWPNESTAFTPWLAQAENLSLLAEAIGIDLELEAQERNVGPFRADLLCKDTGNNHWVLIENQIEPTDHCHLGQLLTYAAGLQAVTIVWVARIIREEHRAALDWLNEITDDRFNFFGLEIELWQIGDSPIAPKFNVVCKPNDWSKTVKSGADAIANTAGGETGGIYLEYWTALRELMVQNHSVVKSQTPRRQYWLPHAIGRSNFVLTAIATVKSEWIAAALVMLGRSAKHFYRLLLSQKEQIESEAGEPLQWEELPDGVESRITLRLEGADVTDRNDWPHQHAWLREKLEKLYRVFATRVKSLSAEAEDPANSL